MKGSNRPTIGLDYYHARRLPLDPAQPQAKKLRDRVCSLHLPSQRLVDGTSGRATNGSIEPTSQLFALLKGFHQPATRRSSTACLSYTPFMSVDDARTHRISHKPQRVNGEDPPSTTSTVRVSVEPLFPERPRWRRAAKHGGMPAEGN